MQSTTTIQPSTPPKDPIIAAILSFFLLGGVGQLYLGQQRKGIILIVVWIIGLCTFGTVSTVVSILGAIDAYMIGAKLKEGKSVGDMEFFWQSRETSGGGAA